MMREDPGSWWKRPERWGTGPLTFLYVGQGHKQLISDFLAKFKAFFGEDELHVKLVGGMLFSITFKPNGNTIYFYVHDNVQLLRERVQAVAAHTAFIDEMPKGSMAIKAIEEITARLTDYRGYLIMSFTPKSLNREIKKWVESLEPPLGRKYTLSFLANPAMDEEAKQQRIASIANHSAAYQKTLLEGDWLQGDNLVFPTVEEAYRGPIGYAPHWRHVVGFDPGMSSACGVVWLAEDPSTCLWYVVRAYYYESLKDPEKSIELLQADIKGINVAKVVYDPASDWWAQLAAKRGVRPLDCPADKNNRKDEMIANVQLSLGSNVFISPWCEELIEELNTMSWSPTVEGKIQANSKFHCADALRYAIDCLPAASRQQAAASSWEADLRQQNERWKQKEKERHASAANVRQPFRGHPVTRIQRVWGRR